MSARAPLHPYPLPAHLAPRLERLHAYWLSLLRGEARMPFADDFWPTELGDLNSRLILIDVFERPVRFRLQSVGDAFVSDGAAGMFLDEVRLGAPLDFMASQASATVEAAAPTFYKADAGRLLLPLWGEGRISLLAGAVDLA